MDVRNAFELIFDMECLLGTAIDLVHEAVLPSSRFSLPVRELDDVENAYAEYLFHLELMCRRARERVAEERDRHEFGRRPDGFFRTAWEAVKHAAKSIL